MALTVPAACILAAAYTYQLPPPIILAVLEVEGGKIGTQSRNRNGSYDLGPMQVNTIWVKDLSKRLRMDQQDVATRLVYDPCFNVGVGSWILRSKINEAGSFWKGVAHYHSKTPHLGSRYMYKVYGALVKVVTRAQQAPAYQQPLQPARPDGRRG